MREIFEDEDKGRGNMAHNHQHHLFSLTRVFVTRGMLFHTSPSASTTTASPTAAVAAGATASTTARVSAHLLQLVRHMLICLLQDGDQVPRTLGIVRGEEGDGRSEGTRATGSTDSVDVVFRIVGEIVVENVRDILDI